MRNWGTVELGNCGTVELWNCGIVELGNWGIGYLIQITAYWVFILKKIIF